MSLKAKELSKLVECLVCKDISTQEIYQCKNGHQICGKCTAAVDVCPKCSVDLKVSGYLLRNLVTESLVALIKVPCPFRIDGCKDNLQRENLESHTRECKYRGNSIQLCRRLGYDCEFFTNTSRADDAVTHFSQHEVIVHSGNHVSIHLLEFSSKLVSFEGKSLLGRWKPIMVTTSDLSKLMILVNINRKQDGHHLSFKCVLMETAIQVRRYEAEFSIQSQNTRVLPLKWKQDAIPVTDFQYIGFSLNIPASLISNFFIDRKGNVAIDVRVWSDESSKALIDTVANKPTVEIIQLTEIVALDAQIV